MLTSGNVDTAVASSAESDEDEFIPLRCWECNVNFTEKRYLYNHLFHHVRQPFIVVERCNLPPLKLTLSKSVTGNGFEIISNGKPSDNVEPATNLAENRREETVGEETVGGAEVKKENVEKETLEEVELENIETRIRFSPDLGSLEDIDSSCTRLESPASNETTNLDNPAEKSNIPAIHSSASNGGVADATSANDYGASIPGAEPTPPPEPSPDYPKIRIKTTGLLKEPLTITEITDDNPNGDPNFGQNGGSNMWTTPSLEDPLKLPDGNADDGILALFNGSDGSRAKDLGFHSSDSEFISLDRLEERNRGAMALYNPSTSQSSQNPLDSLTGLPMQALAQQVSRLQPSNNSGAMHQQNVLINIQQFPSGPPPQPSYQPPPMYAHHYAPQPMHQPYQYQPPNPMYYPPAPPGYPPQPHMPPPPQMPPISQPHAPQHGMGGNQAGTTSAVTGQQMPPTSQHQQPPQQNQQGGGPQHGPPYRQMAPRQQGPPRPPAAPGVRMPTGGPRQPMVQRQQAPRQRAPMIRARGGGVPSVGSRGGIRPRMPGTLNGTRMQQSPVKRTPEQMAQLQAKKKRFDLLTPDKDDEDCQVICMQPKNTDGGLPQIESVQGGTSEPSENSIMHLSDSITLSVRNPPPKPVAAEPKKSDAKAVANILATRGITVTATAKPKEKESPQKPGAAPSLPTSLNLNGAVSIIPAKGGNGGSKPSTPEPLPTVDLTDDATTTSGGQQLSQKQRPGLPYRCDLCPATYPNAPGLNRHRQTYHKTTGGMCELGIPLVNLKAPGALQRLSSLGINSYIPVPSSGQDGTFALPIINTRNPANVNAIGATTMLSLGPIRTIPRPQNGAANPNAAKPANVQKS